MYFYRVRYTDPDSEHARFLRHETKYNDLEFEALCDRCLPVAIERAINEQSPIEIEGKSPQLPRIIDWSDIVDRINMILVMEKGFISVSFTSATYSWGGHRGGDAFDLERDGTQPGSIQGYWGHDPLRKITPQIQNALDKLVEFNDNLAQKEYEEFQNDEGESEDSSDN
jgi:hypothetical protein